MRSPAAAPLAFVGVLVAVLIAGCASLPGGGPTAAPTSPDAPELEVAWSLVRAADAEGELPVVDGDASLDLSADDASTGSRSYCNGFSVETEGSGDPFRVQVVAMTEAACADPERQALETRYVDALGAVERAEVAAGILVLTGDDVRLEFVPAD